MAAELHVFYRINLGGIFHIHTDIGTSRYPHDDWTRQSGAPAAAGDPATLETPGQQHVFYRNGNGGISHIFWDAPTKQFPHDDWTRQSGAPAAAGIPALIRFEPPALHSPRILAFRITPTRINQGTEVTITWQVEDWADCLADIRLIKKDYPNDRTVLGMSANLPTTGELTEKPPVSTKYYLSVTCRDGTRHTEREITVGVVTPPPPSAAHQYCYKVVTPASGICTTVSWWAQSQADADAYMRAEWPGATITKIDCSALTTACGG